MLALMCLGSLVRVLYIALVDLYAAPPALEYTLRSFNDIIWFTSYAYLVL